MRKCPANHKVSIADQLSGAMHDTWKNLPEDSRPEGSPVPPNPPTPKELVDYALDFGETEAIELFERRLTDVTKTFNTLPPDCRAALESTIQKLATKKTLTNQLTLMKEADLPRFTTTRLIAAIKLWAFVRAHTDSVKNQFPPGQIIRLWINRPTRIRADLDRGIIPISIIPSRPAYLTSSTLPDNTGPGQSEPIDQFLDLPITLKSDGAQRWQYESPILLADLNSAGLRHGRGARLDKRILMLSLFSMPASERKPGGRFEVRETLRSIAERWLWPSSNPHERSTKYDRAKHGEALLNALSAMNKISIPVERGALYHPVIVRQMPNIYDLDSEMILEIALPAGSGHGPLIDTQLLASQGRVSDPAFDLQIALAYLWDEAKRRNGGNRVYATRPEALRNSDGHIIDSSGAVILDDQKRPTSNWNDPRAVRTGRMERNPAIDKVPTLDKDGRRALVYSPRMENNRIIQKDQKRIRYERANTKLLLEKLEEQGIIVIERDGDEWRIIEPLPPDHA